jgi:uncharacterized protein (TIGR03435 family)
MNQSKGLMIHRKRRHLNLARKVLLALAGVAALAGPAAIGVVIGISHAPAARAQSQTAAPPEFDAASIRTAPALPGGRGVIGFPGRLVFEPGRVSSRQVSVGRIILEAWHLHDYQLSGGPGWLATDLFAIEAKTEKPVGEEQLRLMLQTMLTKRFKLVSHRETKEMAVLAMTVAKGGPKLHELKPGESVPSSLDEMVRLGLVRTRTVQGSPAGNMFDQGTMQTLADQLYFTFTRAGNGGDARPVLDKTGLTGNYLFFLQWGADEDVRETVQEVMGLKLEPQKAPVEVLVVDHIEKPEPN